MRREARSILVAARTRAPGDLAEYERLVERHLVPEMVAGRRLLRLFTKHPRLMHAAMATPPGWRAFQAACRGELSMADVLRRAPVRAVVGLLS